MRVYLPWRKVPAGMLCDLLSMQRVRSAAFREKRAMDWLTFQTYGYYSNTLLEWNAQMLHVIPSSPPYITG